MDEEFYRLNGLAAEVKILHFLFSRKSDHFGWKMEIFNGKLI